MVGANYSIFRCLSSRKKSGVAIFKVPQGEDEWSSNWRKSIIGVVTKDHVIDKALREKIMKKYIFVCENHYSEDQLIRCIYKIISFPFPQKLLRVSGNLGKQAYYKLTKRLSPLLLSSLKQLLKIKWKFLHFLDIILNAPRQNTVCVLKKCKRFAWIYWKKVFVKWSGYLLCIQVYNPKFLLALRHSMCLRNNEQFKISKTNKWRKSKNNKIQRKSTVSSYKKECAFILL